MSTGRLSKGRLGRLHDVMARHVERGDAPGVVTLVSRRGESRVDAIGTMAIDGSDPIRRDTIFRITSMTKPVTAAAAMVLVEECKLQLDEPVDRLLPELADRRVLKRLDGPLDDTEPAKRPITVRDLLSFGMGFGLMFGPPDAYPILRALEEQQIMIGPPKPPTPHAPEEWMRRVGSLPLMHQPGERWMYNTGAHVLGVLIARASGQPFGMFLRERIFEPLGMTDTAFSVPADKLDRFPPCYEEDPQGAGLRVHDAVQGSQWAGAPVFPDGAAGLVSTVDDYFAFGQMMLRQGVHGRERILSRPSVEVMTTDQLTPERRAASDLFLLGDSYGWGFGVAVCRRRDDISAVPGRFGWDGGYGTSWYSDPTEDVVGILMTQCLAAPQYSSLRLDFWTSAYQAIED